MHPLGCWTAGRQAAKWRRVADRANRRGRDDRPAFQGFQVCLFLYPLLTVHASPGAPPRHRSAHLVQPSAPLYARGAGRQPLLLPPRIRPTHLTPTAAAARHGKAVGEGSPLRHLRWMIPRARSYLAEWCRSHSSKRCCPCTTPSFTWTTTLLSSSLTGPLSPSSTAIRIRTTPKCISRTYIRPHADCFVSQDLLLSAVEQHGYSYQAATTSQPLPERCHHLSRHMGSRE